MSFLSVLKSIGHVIGVGATAVAPFEGLIGDIPVVGPVASTIISSIVSIEGLITQPSTGAQKKQIAISIINTVHPGLDQANLGAAIDGVVAGFNLIEQALGKLPATAPAPAK